jgi:chromosomal replication initiator protein
MASIGLDPSLTFATYVTGTSNVLAANAAQRMAALEQPQFSPLYLKAATGQGKTHLMHAIGHAFLANHPRARIFYCSAERFMVEFVQALRSNQTIEFKARLRGFDLLLVDDIQFIIGKASAQEELLYTIDSLLGEGKRLVFAADRAPRRWTAWSSACSRACRWVWSPISSPPTSSCAAPSSSTVWRALPRPRRSPPM